MLQHNCTWQIHTNPAKLRLISYNDKYHFAESSIGNLILECNSVIEALTWNEEGFSRYCNCFTVRK